MNKLITTILLCFTIFISKAQTNVNSYNVNDSIWEKSNSPYYITGQISIPIGKTLKIEPGVKVIFKGNYSITVNGYIDCKGTAANKIEFIGDSLAPNIYVLWGSINIYSGVSGIYNIYYFKLKYCVFKNGQGINIPGIKTIFTFLDNCEFYNNSRCYKTRGDLDSIYQCKFENNVSVFECNQNSLVVLYSTIQNNELLIAGNIYRIENSKIINNGIGTFNVFHMKKSELRDCYCSSVVSSVDCNNIGIRIVNIDSSVIDNTHRPYLYDAYVGQQISNSVIKSLKSISLYKSTDISPISVSKNVVIDNKNGLILNGQNTNATLVTCNKFINNGIAITFSLNQMDYVKNNTFCGNLIDVKNTSSQSQNLTQNYFCSANIEDKLVDKTDSAHLGSINYNIYNSTQQIVTKVIAKDKSILSYNDTTNAIDTSCLSKVDYLYIDLNTPDTICHKLGTTYLPVNPTILTSFFLNQISLVKTYAFNGPVNANIRGRYEEIYTATAPNGDKVQKVRVVIVDYECISSLKIILNTPDTVCHKVNTPYNSVNPSVQSDVFTSSQISLSKISSNVDPNKLGFYFEVFEAVDARGHRVLKTRYVIVKEDCDNNNTAISKILSKSNIIYIYPNPANSLLTIEVLNGLETEFKLIDAQGKEVWNSQASSAATRTIDVENLSSGIYYLVAKNNISIFTEKIVVQH